MPRPDEGLIVPFDTGVVVHNIQVLAKPIDDPYVISTLVLEDLSAIYGV